MFESRLKEHAKGEATEQRILYTQDILSKWGTKQTSCKILRQ